MVGLRRILELLLATTLTANAQTALPPPHRILPYVADARTVLDLTNHTLTTMNLTVCYSPSNIQPPLSGIYKTPSCKPLRVNPASSVQLDDIVRAQFGHADGVGVLLLSNSSSSTTVSMNPVAVPAGASFKMGVMLDAQGTDWAAAQFDLQLPSDIATSAMTAGAASTKASKTIASNGPRALIYGINQNALADGELAVATLRVNQNTPQGTLPLGTKNVVVATADARNASATELNIYPAIPNITVLPAGSGWIINGQDLSKLEVRSTTYQRQTDTASPFYSATQGSSIQGLTLDQLLKQGKQMTIMGPDDTAMYQSNVGFYATQEPVIIKATLKDRNGTALSTKSISVDAYQHLLQPTFQFFGVSPQPNVAIIVEGTAGNSGGAYGYIVDAKSRAGFITPAQGPGGKFHIVKAANAASSRNNLLVRSSNGATQNTITTELYKPGTTSPATLNDAFIPGIVKTYPNIVGLLNQPVGTVGSLRVSSASATPHTMTLARDTTALGSTMGANLQGIGEAEAAIGRGTASDVAVTPGINGLPAARTSVGIVNISNAPLSGKVIAYDSAGKMLATYAISAQANEPKLYPGLLQNLSGDVRIKLQLDNDTLGTTHRALFYAITTDTNGLVQFVRTGFKP